MVIQAIRLVKNCTTGEETQEVFVPEINTFVETEQQITAKLSELVQNHMDMVARGRRYDNISSLASYADDVNPIFNREGTAGKAWRSACWLKCKEIEVSVIEGSRSIPTEQELLGELPIFEWGD